MKIALANGFSTNNLLGARQEIIMVISQKKLTIKYKEKVVILQSIGIIVIKSKETRWSPIPVDILVGI